MEVEQKDGSDNTLANGKTNPAKRGRGRPRGSLNKKIVSVTEVTHNVRTSKQVDFFSPETIKKPKVKKRGRPKKIRMPGRPRKIPLTPEEEAERILRFSKQRKRRLSKPLGRPRIHPIVDIPKVKRGRGRPRKYEVLARPSSQNGTVNGNLKKSLKRISEFGEATPRKRGRPCGSFKKKLGTPFSSPANRATPGKRGRPPGSRNKISAKLESNGFPRKRGRPPGSGTKQFIQQEGDGTPRKRGRPPGSGMKMKLKSAEQESDGTPRKRGRPPGSLNKVKVLTQEANESPRKRGRPPGSGKPKTDAKETEDSDFSCSSAFSVSNQPRKRGRPSKASLAEASRVSKAGAGQSEVIGASLPKQPRNSFGLSENSGEEGETLVGAGDQACENNATLMATSVEKGETLADAGDQASENNATLMATSVPLPEGDGEEKKQLEEAPVLVIGNESRRYASKVAGKLQKKK